MINEINVDFPLLPVSKYAEQLNQEAAAHTSLLCGTSGLKSAIWWLSFSDFSYL